MEFLEDEKGTLNLAFFDSIYIQMLGIRYRINVLEIGKESAFSNRY